MYSARLIHKKTKKQLKKIIKKTDSLVSDKLEQLLASAVKQYKHLFELKIEELKSNEKQISRDLEVLSEKKNAENETKDLEKILDKTKEDAESLESFFGKFNFEKKLEKKKDDLLKHSKCVYYIAKEINANVQEKLDERVVEYAAIMHDAIKIIDSSHRHSVNSRNLLIDLVEASYFEEKLDKKELETISKAIYLHNRGEKIYKGTEYSDEELLACIIHDADKISKVYKKRSWKKHKKYLKVKDYEKGLKKIRKKLFLIESEEILVSHLNIVIGRELSFV